MIVRITIEDNRTEFVFESTEHRDEFLSRMFPKRESISYVPGAYILPDGSALHIATEYVTHYLD